MYIHVRVTPKAKRESLVKKNDDHWVVSVREPAERNLANRRVCELVAAELGLPPEWVRIVNGHQSPSKLLSIAD